MLMNLLVAILPTGLLIFVMFYFMRQMTGANNGHGVPEDERQDDRGHASQRQVQGRRRHR